MATSSSILVLGLGNVLWADDGFGVRAVEALQQRCRFPARVTLLDGAGQEFALLQQVQDAEVLVVFDAVEAGIPPGSLVRLEGEALSKRFGARSTSLHQGGLAEVLALAEALGRSPAHRLLIGVQPVSVDRFGAGLSPPVRRQLEPALGMALEFLARFDATPLGPLAAEQTR